MAEIGEFAADNAGIVSVADRTGQAPDGRVSVLMLPGPRRPVPAYRHFIRSGSFMIYPSGPC